MTSELAKYGFKFSLATGDFLNRVHDQGQYFQDRLRDIEAIIPLKDMARFPDIRASGRMDVGLMEESHLKNIIRSIKDSRGKYVYEDADISFGGLFPRHVYSSQTFVQSDKLLSINELFRLFKNFNWPGLSKSPSYLVKYSGTEGRFAAIYVPPVVEMIDKQELEEPVENLRQMAKLQDTIELPTRGQNGIIRIGDEIRRMEKLLANRSIYSIPILKDGTHRSYSARIFGVEIHTIFVNGSTALPASVPLMNDDVVMTSEKPKEKQHRFLGYNPKAWIRLDESGIDG